jgi:GST-like protein
MYTLYAGKGSGSAAVEAALEIIGAKFTIVNAASWANDPGVEELRQVNPLLQIPTLRLPDGSVMTESAAILIHLGLVHPKAGLLPADKAARAQQIRGLVYIAANCYAAIGISDYPERWTTETDKAAIEKVRAGTRARLHRYWEIFADQFPARPFFNGGTPGALDLLASVVSKWSGTRAHLREKRPVFLATLEMIEQVPAIAAVYARHWKPPG